MSGGRVHEQMHRQPDESNGEEDPRMRFSSGCVEETIELGRLLAGVLAADDVVVLSGDLGAGKTHFTKGVAAGLGVSDPITSPTFNLVLEYEGATAAGDPIVLYHFDLYRLDEASQLADIDYFGLLESDGVSLVEWGDRFPEACAGDCLHVDITLGFAEGPDASTTRTIEAWAPAGSTAAERLAAWREACMRENRMPAWENKPGLAGKDI